eukprot:CAMPEP_0115741204 /NCGR_PEP_ID=MMETSP0272-20121206/89884_1 /TAXON_ID=71861 /ORGANISM="Scrippsiella trochoidea, Strain CCMP3099" /LENGTH=79 /DNA_ID=CAMNT_0003185873 /DNA_START=263 /DNA_END=498 /DNA_ORIENTATION=-
MHWITVQHLDLKLLVPIERSRRAHRADASDVTVRQDKATNLINHKASAERARRGILFETSDRCDLEGHDGRLKAGDDLR